MDDHNEGSDRVSIGVTIGSVVLLVLFSPWLLNIKLMFLAMQFVFISVIIWQACDPFADAAQWVGKVLRLPGSVRGATLDAIASSMPELYTGLFFVIVAVSGSSGAVVEHHDGEGFGSALATCAGSAVYNMILIPAFCVLVISASRKSRPTIDIEQEVISRDGMWFLAAEAVLILFMFQDKMYWWMGVVLLVMYAVYVLQLYRDARLYQSAMKLIDVSFEDDVPPSRDLISDKLRQVGIEPNPSLIDQIRRHRGDDEETVDSAGLLYGMFEVPLSAWSASLIIVISTIIAGASCYWLVEVASATATELDIPLFFVAVILVAAASSVPDTFLSIGAAKRGDDSGAVSNAFGSNIFDICVSLSIPLIVNAYLLGWEGVPMTVNGEPMQGLVDLRILLAIMTGITLLIMWNNRQLTRFKGWVLCGLYLLFIAYAIAGSLGYTIFS